MEHTFLDIVLKLSFFQLPDLTNLPLSHKRDKFNEYTPTFNHFQFQDTCMYLLKSVGIIKEFVTLHSSCNCNLLLDWNNFKHTFKKLITTHT